MNIMPKQDGHATVARRELQYWHCVESDETAAPQLKQFKVSACMRSIVALLVSWTTRRLLCDAGNSAREIFRIP